MASQTDDDKHQHNDDEHIILSFGKNNKFQTGHNILSNILSPKMIKFPKKTNPIYITCGFDHCGMIDSVGNVMLWGDNEHHQINNSNKQPYVLPQRLSFSKRVSKIAATSDCTLLLDTNGKVWSIGAMNKGNLSMIEFTFYDNKNEHKIIDICCGYKHFGAISNMPKLYVWGNNQYSQLGIGGNCKNKKIHKPTLTAVNLNKEGEIKKCAMGRWHTLVLTQNGYIFSCGWGRFGVLGLGDTYNRKRFEYVAVTQRDFKVDDIECGAVHNCCIVKDKNDKKSVYVWGRGRDGRLGIGKETNILQPTYLKMRFVHNGDCVKKIKLGGDDGIIISEFGDVYVWGKAKEGQLGFDNGGKCVTRPMRLRLSKQMSSKYEPVDVAMGDCHSLLLMKKKR